MNILITGANGLLASNVIIQLINKGHSVRAMLRDEKKFIDFKHPNLSIVVGDITNYNDLELAINGTDYVIHAAANTSLDLLYLADYHDTNVLATKNPMSVFAEQDDVQQQAFKAMKYNNPRFVPGITYKMIF